METLVDILFFVVMAFIILAAIPVLLAAIELWPIFLAIALFVGGISLKRRAVI